MKTIKQTAEYTVMQRRDGRYAVRGKERKWINGDDKVAILVKEGLLKQDAPKPQPKAQESEAESADDAAGGAAEETGGESEEAS